MREIICQDCMAHYPEGYAHTCPPWLKELVRVKRAQGEEPPRPQNLCLILSRNEWLADPIYKWKPEEIDAADATGLIGTKYGVDCYLARNVPATS